MNFDTRMILTMTDGQWLVDLRNLESQYNNKRWNFRNKFKRYIRNNPYSEKYTEEELIKDLQELSELRNKMKDFSKNNNFKGSNEHMYHLNRDDFFFTASKPTW